MYSLRSELLATPGRTTDLEAWNSQLFDVLRAQPGYQGGALLNALGYPTKYTRITVWDDRAALKAFWQSAAIQTFAQQHPAEGIFTAPKPIEAYEIIHRVSESGQPGHAVLVDWTIDPGKAEAFEQSRNELFELRRKAGRGMVTSALSRFLGSPNRYVVYHSSLSGDDLQAFFTSEECQAWAARHAAAAYASTPAQIEAFEVVHAQVLARA